MSRLIRRIVFLVIAIVLPFNGWAMAFVPHCAMTAKVEAMSHCSGDMQMKHDGADSTKAAHTEAAGGSDCHCAALHQPAIPFVAGAVIGNAEFFAPLNRFVIAPHAPLWRPPITA